MADPITLLGLLTAGATVVAQATIEEATKEAWQGLKNATLDVFGRRTSAGLEKLAKPDLRAEGQRELGQVLGPLGEHDAAIITPAMDRLVAAMKRDATARDVLARNDINLDLDVGGDVLIQRIQDAQGINVRSRSDGNFTLTDVGMRRDPASGN